MSYEFDGQAERRLRAYFEEIGDILRHRPKREVFALYATGLLGNLERKSVEPIAAYLCSEPQQVDPMHQKLLHFQSAAAWDDRAVRLCAARHAVKALTEREGVRAWIIDDTGFLKQGAHSVGVQRQYTGSAGKVANCQIGVSLTLATATAHVPVDFELYLPESWTEDPERRRQGKIPSEAVFKTKNELALDMISRATAADLPGQVVLADAAYGDSKDFRATVRLLGFDYAVGVSANTLIRVVDKQRQPTGVSTQARDLAALLPMHAFRRVTWRQGTSTRLSARFAFLRVTIPTDGDKADVQWLIIEWRDGDKAPEHFALTTLGVDGRMSKKTIVRLFKERYRTEQAYEEMKGELGLDHFEGRSFQGWHHHISVVLCCYAFVVAERARHGLPSTCRAIDAPDHPDALPLAA
jgi:SRSO17 transposase